MERIDKNDLYALVPQQPEQKAMTMQSPASLEKDTVILRWVRFAARHYKETVTDEDLSMWLKILSSYPRQAVECSFYDYMKREDWMPRFSQITERCDAWREDNAGPPPDSHLKQEMEKWREEEKSNQQDPEYLQAYSGLKDHLRKLWPGTKGGE
jgi:hypothetical protein